MCYNKINYCLNCWKRIILSYIKHEDYFYCKYSKKCCNSFWLKSSYCYFCKIPIEKQVELYYKFKMFCVSFWKRQSFAISYQEKL